MSPEPRPRRSHWTLFYSTGAWLLLGTSWRLTVIVLIGCLVGLKFLQDGWRWRILSRKAVIVSILLPPGGLVGLMAVYTRSKSCC
ncbi:uncharacterized protein IWZ02DRAFT_438706 [Phyllosticta citriasiana]|uniref:uncharacterized protein n=1 Tax=Phyllosticta citriasiana TaxID=595635 RepID=UPI0030FD9AA0